MKTFPGGGKAEKEKKKQQPYEIEIDHLIDFSLFEGSC